MTLVAAFCVTQPSLAQEGSPGEDGQAIIGYEAYGRAPYPLESRGVRFGYGVSASRTLLLTHIESDETVLMTRFQLRETELRLDSRTGSFLHFGVGLGVRDVQLDYKVFVEQQDDAYEVSERDQAIILGGHVGFELPLSAWLVVGTDLFGVTVPVYWTKRNDEHPDEVRDFEEDPKEFPFVRSGFTACYQLARTYIAMRF